jgi:hypothetical protein
MIRLFVPSSSLPDYQDALSSRRMGSHTAYIPPHLTTDNHIPLRPGMQHHACVPPANLCEPAGAI